MNLLNFHYVPGIDLGGSKIVQYCKSFYSVLTTSLENKNYLFYFTHENKKNFHRSKAPWTSNRV